MSNTQKLTPVIYLSTLAGMVAVIASLLGLLTDLYAAMSPALLVGSYGQDLSVLLAVAVMAASIIAARRGSAVGTILWMAILAYLIYSYALYAFGGVYVTLYPVYIALVGLSMYTLVGLAFLVDAKALATRVGGRLPFWVTGLFFLVIIVVLAPRWLGEISKLSGNITYSPYGPIFVLDLGLVFPAFLLSVYWMWRGNPWGRILGGMMLIKAVSVGLNLALGGLWGMATGVPVDMGETLFFGGFGLVALVLAWLFFREAQAERLPETSVYAPRTSHRPGSQA
jgi:hypothetical protein